MNMKEIVRSLTEEREQIDIVLTSLKKISTLATSNRQALTITAAMPTGIAMAPASTGTRKAGNLGHARKRAFSSEQRAKMSQKSKERWAKIHAEQAKKRAPVKVGKGTAAVA